jgi:diguanylate cyclase (GGDEF)-like protein
MYTEADFAWTIATFSLLGLIAALTVMFRLNKRLHQVQAHLCEVVREAEERQAHMKELAGFDVLTGVPGRRVFDETLNREWARGARSHQPLAVLMIDIDHFKRHNDTYGHQAGDECLRKVAAVLKGCLRRPTDVIARYGGEEFGAVLPGVSVAGAMAVAERMRKTVEAIHLPHVNNQTGYDVTVSIGVALMFPSGRLTTASLVAAADEALYTAKAVGRNQVILSESEHAVIVS